jgi:hypothetical protein
MYVLELLAPQPAHQILNLCARNIGLEVERESAMARFSWFRNSKLWAPGSQGRGEACALKPDIHQHWNQPLINPGSRTLRTSFGSDASPGVKAQQSLRKTPIKISPGQYFLPSKDSERRFGREDPPGCQSGSTSGAPERDRSPVHCCQRPAGLSR